MMKNTNGKRWLAALCACAMILAFVPSNAFADDFGFDFDFGGGSFADFSYSDFSFSYDAPVYDYSVSYDTASYDYSGSYDAPVFDSSVSYDAPVYDSSVSNNIPDSDYTVTNDISINDFSEIVNSGNDTAELFTSEVESTPVIDTVSQLDAVPQSDTVTELNVAPQLDTAFEMTLVTDEVLETTPVIDAVPETVPEVEANLDVTPVVDEIPDTIPASNVVLDAAPEAEVISAPASEIIADLGEAPAAEVVLENEALPEAEEEITSQQEEVSAPAVEIAAPAQEVVEIPELRASFKMSLRALPAELSLNADLAAEDNTTNATVDAPVVEEKSPEEVPVVEEKLEKEIPAIEEKAIEELFVVEEKLEEAPVAEEKLVEEFSSVEEKLENVAPVIEKKSLKAVPVTEENLLEKSPAAQEVIIEEVPSVGEATIEESPSELLITNSELAIDSVPTEAPLTFSSAAETLFAAAKNTIREFFGLKVEYNEEEVEIEENSVKEEITLKSRLSEAAEATNVTVSNADNTETASGSIFVGSSNIILTLKNLIAKAVNNTAAVSFAQPEDADSRSSYSLVIEGDVDLSSKQTAIEVKDGVDLDITGASGKDGEDSLTATGTGKHGAGIGFYNKVDDAGNITIHDLHEVSAAGGTNDEGGVAIGGGRHFDEANGHIVIEDVGSVTAVGGGKAAAIGGGFWRGVDIVINRVDEILATGGKTAAAIGSSRNAIEGDEANPDNPALATSIHITDSNITAVGGENAAAIGTGYSDRVYSDYSRVDTNKATGEKFLGSDVALPETTIVIDGNSVIEATGGKYASAIGGGYKVYSPDITIGSGAVVTAYAGSNGGDTAKASSAIGSGADGSSIYSSKDAVITIEEGAVVRGFSNGFDLILNQTDAKKSALGNRWAIAREAEDNSTASILQGRFLKADQLGEAGKEEAGEMSFYNEKASDSDRTLTIVNLADGSEETLTIRSGYTSFALTVEPGSYQLLLDGKPLSFLETEGFQAVTEGNTPDNAAVPYRAQTVYGDDEVSTGSYVDYTHTYNPYGSSSDTVDLHYAYGAPDANFDVTSGINSFDAIAVRSSTLPYGNVTVRYLNDEGEVLRESYVSEDLLLGSEYDVTLSDKLDIDGYEYDHTDGDLSGILDHNRIITVYYSALTVEEEVIPVEEPAEVSAEEPDEEPAEVPAEEPAEVPAEEAVVPTEESSEIPVEDSADEAAEEEKPEAPAEEPAEEPAETPVEESSETVAEESEEASVEEVEEPKEAPAEEPSEVPAETPVEESSEATSEEPAEAPEENAEDSADEAAEEEKSEAPAEEAAEEPSITQPFADYVQATVYGQLPNINISADVNAVLASINDFGTPLGVSSVFNNLGICFE